MRIRSDKLIEVSALTCAADSNRKAFLLLAGRFYASAARRSRQPHGGYLFPKEDECGQNDKSPYHRPLDLLCQICHLCVTGRCPSGELTQGSLLGFGCAFERQPVRHWPRIEISPSLVELFAPSKVARVELSGCPASAPMRQIGRVEEGRISGSS